IKTGRGWFIDQVELASKTTSSATVELTQIGEDTATLAKTFVVTWKSPRNEVAFELDVSAHRGIETSKRTRRVVHVLGAAQTEWYQLVETPTLAIAYDQSLLPFAVNETNNVPDWVADRVTNDVSLLFAGAGRNLPPLSFDVSASRFAVSEFVRITASKDLETTGIFDLQPSNRPLKTLTVTVPSQWIGNTQLRWIVDGQRLKADQIHENADALEGHIQYELQLRNPIVEPVYLEVDGLEFAAPEPDETEASIPILRFENGELQQVVAVIPRSLLLESSGRSQTRTQIELLPAKDCCNPAIATKLGLSAEGNATIGEDASIAMRFEADSGLSPQLQATLNPTQATSAWIEAWDETHRFAGNHLKTHSFDFVLRGKPGDPWEITCPASYQLVRYESDTKALRSGFDAMISSESIIAGRIPGDGSDRIKLTFESQSANNFWFRAERLSSLKTALPIVQSSSQILVAPGWLALSNSKLSTTVAPDDTKRALDLSPSTWWNRFSLSNTSPNRLDDGWSRYVIAPTINSGDLGSCYFVRNSGLAAVAMVSVGLLSLMSFSLFVRLPRLGWTFLWAALIALLWVPQSYVPILQLAALSLTLGLTTRMVAFLLEEAKKRDPHDGSRVDHSPSRRLGLLRVGLPFLALLSASASSSATAQLRTTGDYRVLQSETASDQYIPVFIPENADGEVDSSYVYIRESFLQTLDGVGRNQDSRDTSTWIESAEYSVRLVQDSADLTSRPGLVAEYRVRIGENSPLLNLPFLSSELRLLRAEVDDQPGAVEEGSVFQDEANSLVTFNPMTAGTHKLTLVFETQTEERNRDFRTLEATIPRFASSVLQINADPSLEVLAVNGVERVPIQRGQKYYIGPTNKINLRWKKSLPQSTTDSDAKTRHRVWVHTTGDRCTVGMA
ncbi:MAG: hypothetical protein AAGG44_16260, partial [Planctomycetota bacterium]